MKRFAVKAALSFALVLMVLTTLHGQVSDDAFFIPLTSAQSEVMDQQLDLSQLPPGVDIGTPDVYQLQSAHADYLAVVPIHFDYGDTPQPSDALPSQCGAFFVKANGQSHYLPIVGPDFANSPGLCGGVGEVGATLDPGPRPRLIFFFTIWTAHPGDDFDEPFVLSWNKASGAYEVDKKTSDWVVQQRKSDTAYQVQKLLAHHH